MNPDLLEKVLEKKFILCVVVTLSSTLLAVLKLLDGESWADLNMVVLGGFVLIEAAEQAIRR